MSTNQDNTAVRYADPPYGFDVDLEKQARHWRLERRVIITSLRGNINRQNLLNNQILPRFKPNPLLNSQAPQIIQPMPPSLILSERSRPQPQPDLVTLPMPSKIGPDIPNQRKRKSAPQGSATVAHPEERVRKRIKSKISQKASLNVASTVCPIQDAGSAELCQWINGVCSRQIVPFNQQ